MDAITRIERALSGAMEKAGGPFCPPRLAAAMKHAVFPRGARVRPRLCIAVAKACGEDDPSIADGAAAAIELLHCASLVHDDLPCFDDADVRRGRPSVHKAFGESTAVLAGDALIVLAFQTIAGIAPGTPQQAGLLTIISDSVGTPSGIVAGQAWEEEPMVEIAAYHRSKTGALFAAAAQAGALSAGHDPATWRPLGERLGEAFQIADDLRDAVGDAIEIGKPIQQDDRNSRPNTVRVAGVDGAINQLEGLISSAIDAVPECAGALELQALISSVARGVLPNKLARDAA